MQLCGRDDPRRQELEDLLVAFGDRVRALADDADMAPVHRAWQRLLSHPCLHSMRPIGRIPSFRRAPAAREWLERGGYAFLAFAASPLPDGLGDVADSVGVPPDERGVLFLETLGDLPRGQRAPPREVLCSISDRACGTQTQGWLRRAEQFFRDRALAREAERERYAGPDHPSRRDRIEACRTQAMAVAADRRWPEWLRCLDRLSDREAAVPLGRFRAPDRGWLVIQGVRGHHQVCYGAAAYDLANGSAYAVDRCNDRPDSTVVERARMGTIPVDNLREAALAIALMNQVQYLRVRGTSFDPVREVFAPWRDSPPPMPEAEPPVTIRTSADTVLSWDWIDPSGRTIASGRFHWHGGGHGDAYAAWLLDLAERGITEGCPPAPLTTRWPATLRRSAVSVNPASGGELVDRLRALTPPASCSAP